jgi:outer membrane usher protein
VSSARLSIIALFAASVSGGAAAAAERELLLEVIMNGRPTGLVGEFLDRGGKLYARPSELHDLGFAGAPETGDDEPVSLSALSDIRTEVNEAKQTLVVTAGDAALRPTEIGGASPLRLAPLTRAGFGAMVNYDMLGTFTDQQAGFGALLDARVFSPYGLLQTTAVANVTPYVGQRSLARLDTTYTYTEADAMRRWRVGDVVTGALSWSRAVRLGGVQLTSDFSVRPDLVTYPLPIISSSATVPSTVDVLVNGIRQYNEPVQAGPFAVRTLPVVTGAGEVAVTVQNAVGQQTLITLPFYASTTLLRPGLASYSAELGAVRRNYGLPNDQYSDWAMNGSVRYGLFDWVTLEGHGEATAGLTLLGMGATLKLGTVGVLNAAASGSSGYGGASSGTDWASSGGLVSLGFQRLSRGFNISVAGTVSTEGYRDLAAVNGAAVPRSTLTASVGYQLGDWGNVSMAYINQQSRTRQTEPVFSRLDYGIINNPQVELVSASYSVPIGGRYNFYATGFKDLRQDRSYGLGIGISFQFGASTSASVGGTLDNGRSDAFLNVAKPALAQNDLGYRIQDREGASAQRQAEGEFLSRWGRVSAGMSQSPGLLAGRAGARGALVLADGSLFASDQISDSFAVVQTGDVGDVPVLYENRLVGTTDASGKLLVPSLLSYQNNRLAVDATRLPADVEVGQTTLQVRPPDGSGVVVDFQVRTVRAGLLKLQERNGKPVPIGSVARVQDAADMPVGYDGEVYLTGLKAANQVTVTRPDGTGCSARFHYTPVRGDIPAIGPLVCQ